MPSTAVALGGEPLLPPHEAYWPPRSDAGEAALRSAYNDAGWWRFSGTWNERLEAALSRGLEGRRVLTVASGTAALEIALRCIGVGVGDEVIVPAVTFVAPAMAAGLCGARVVPVDVDIANWCISPAAAAAAITPRTKAVIAVHLSGRPADLDALMVCCENTGIALIEDCAQAIGTIWNGRPVGVRGRFATFSFQASKTITAGEGGAITFADEVDYRRAQALANNGNEIGTLFTHAHLGTNARLGEFAAAVALPQVEALGEIAARRDRNARAVEAAFAPCAAVRAQPIPPGADILSAWSVALALEGDLASYAARDRLIACLAMERLVAMPLYSDPRCTPSLPLADAALKRPWPVADDLFAHAILILGLFLADDAMSALAGQAIARVLARAHDLV